MTVRREIFQAMKALAFLGDLTKEGARPHSQGDSEIPTVPFLQLRKGTLSLQPSPLYRVPDHTARVARTAVPKGPLGLPLYDELGTIFVEARSCAKPGEI